MKHLNIFILLFIIISCSPKVRVNIIGYPKLEKFTMTLDNKSYLIIDNKKFSINTLIIYPKESTFSINNNIKNKFKKIIIINKNKININCEYGNQNYTGNFYFIKNDNELKMINTINTDDYFASVLGSEMGEYFNDQTLMAQSIAIRTYYYKRKNKYKNKNFDINNADGRDMVYRGSDFATKKMYEIFKQTENLFLVDKKYKLILPLFHSTSNGIILNDFVLSSKLNENIGNPILLKDIDDDLIPLSIDSPFYNFNAMLNKDDIKKILSPDIKLKDLKDIKLKYFNNIDCVDFIGFQDSDEIYWIKAYKFISMAQRKNYNNIRSISFKLNKNKDYYFFEGAGFGHLCGMSQYSAEKLAKLGYDYQYILKKYYPDAVLIKRNIFIDYLNLL